MPFWINLLDLAVLGSLAVGALVLLFGGFRLSAGSLKLSVTSWWRVGAWALVLAAVRHALRRHPSLPVRVVRYSRRTPRTLGLGAMCSIGLAPRLAVLLVGYLAILAVGPATTGVRPDAAGTDIWDVPGARLHAALAASGYGSGALGAARDEARVFPALPMLMRAGGRLMGRRPLLAGSVIALVAFLTALAYLYRLARSHLDHDAALAALAFMGAYPFAVFYSVAATDALILLASVAAFYELRRGACLRAGAWGLLAGLAAPAGFLLSVPLLLVAARPVEQDHVAGPPARAEGGGALDRLRGARRLAAGASALVPVAGMLGYLVYVQTLTGESLPALWRQATFSGSAWAAVTTMGGTAARLAGDGLLPSIAAAPLRTLDLAVLAVVFGLAWPVTRRFGLAQGAFLLAGLVPPMLFGAPSSVGRAAAVLFPAFLWMGAVVPGRHRAAWLSAFAALQAMVAVLFFTWRQAF